MKNQLILAFLSSLFIVVASSCNFGLEGNGNVVTDLREQAPFSEIEIAGAFEIELKEGDSYFLEVEADDNLLDNIISGVANGVLTIENETPVRKATALRLKIQAREITSIDLAGASDLRTVSKLTSKRLEVDGAGASQIDLDFRGDELRVDLSGASEVKLDGRARNLLIDVAGAAEVDAEDLAAKFVSVEIAGAGDVTVNAAKALDIDISGSGEVKYKGQPKITKKIAGAGSIKAIE